MDYRTVDDMYERGATVQLTDRWTSELARYRSRPAVVIDVEVIGFPRDISRQENGRTITQKYGCIYTVALMAENFALPTYDNTLIIRGPLRGYRNRSRCKRGTGSLRGLV